MANAKLRYQQLMRRYVKERKPFSGKIVGAVPGVENMVYIQPDSGGQPIIACNYEASNDVGLPVRVGYDDISPGVLQVLGVRILSGIPFPSNPQVGQHAASHLWGGRDPVYVHIRQITDLAVYPSADFEITVNSGFILTTRGAVRVDKQALDMSSFQPASGACYVLIYINSYGIAAVLAGVTAELLDLTIASIPGTPESGLGLAAVRLYAGQTAISNNYKAPDIIDLRMFSKVNDATTAQARMLEIEHHMDIELTRHRVTGG